MSLSLLFLVIILAGCSFGKQICCPSLGDACFDNLKQYSFQPIPECPTGNLEPSFYLFTRDDDNPDIFQLQSLPFDKLMKRSLYRVIVHGWGADISNDDLIQLKNELLIKENANVILLNSTELMKYGQYPTTAANTRTLGAYMAIFFKEIKDKQSDSHIWCIGHSLGAHSCGHAGQKMKIDRITGLDPAFPLFQGILDPSIGLSPDDADFVDVIHTSSLMGIFKRLGHADFYANGGRVQPACGHFDRACNHAIAVKYMTQTVKNQCGGLKKCSNIWFQDLTCSECTDCLMGYDADPENHGAFLVEVRAEEPYC